MRAAIIQTTTGIDPTANARSLASAIAEAAAGGADMAFTPEMSGALDLSRERLMRHAAPEAEDIVLAAAREAAAKAGIWVHIGSIAMRAEDRTDRLANRSFVIDGSGEIRARYDKIHLFDVDLPSGERYRESATYRAGSQARVVDTPWGRLGLSICYDLRFAGLYQQLTDAGATMISVPAAFTVPTGQAHWHVLLRARAIEAGVFVIAAAQTGKHEDGRSTFGHSLAIDPWGEVLLDMGEGAGIGYAGLEPGRVEEVRARVPAIRHRLPIGVPDLPS